jgi:Icc-related predicted phosphoesterase
MKVLHCSDRGVKNFSELYSQCDILVATGDLTFFDFGNLADISNKKPAFGVYGNHCSGTYFESLGITNLHNKVLEFDNLKWGGFQGCLKYKDSRIYYTEEEAVQFANNFPYVDVLLLHAGPREMLDDPSDPVHVGSESIKRYVFKKKPRYIFLGHQYTDADMTVEGIKLIRTFGARLVDI